MSETGGAGYTVLARRYRSRGFDELIGQEPIVRTLRNSIEQDRTAHAYLFTGTRGVGKTSMARLFAKALNVTDDLAEAEAISNAILRGDDLDVIEIDGASNRGIDQARDLIASAGLAPSRCRYRIYIIDEVHMLTKEAFNALLKTMEEPPSHVKFILCTTEAHKVPATIQSRCQRFDFRPIPAREIAKHVRLILDEEGVTAADDVVLHVARLGNGSMRDALSVLDRLLAAGDKTLTHEILEQTLGLPDHALVFAVGDAIAKRDAGAALAAANELLGRGSTVEQCLEVIADHLRTLMVVAACGSSSELVELTDDARNAAAEQAATFDVATLVHLIALCDATARNARSSSASRALFDAAVARMAMTDRFESIDGAIASASQKKSERSVATPAPVPAPVTAPVPVPAPVTAPVPVTMPAPVVEVKPTDDGPLSAEKLWSRAQNAATKSDARNLQYLSIGAWDPPNLRLVVSEEGSALSRWLGTQKDAIADLFRRAAGTSIRLELDFSKCEEQTAPETTAQDRAEVEQIPVVRRALELFDGAIVRVEEEKAEGAEGLSD